MRGIVNTIRRARELTRTERICAVVGGIHLMGATENRLEQTINEFRRLQIQRIGVSHSTGTGPLAGARLAQKSVCRVMHECYSVGITFSMRLSGTSQINATRLYKLNEIQGSQNEQPIAAP